MNINTKNLPTFRRPKLPEIYKWHGFTVNYIILAIILGLLVLVILAKHLGGDDDSDDGFFHLGWGGPDGTDPPKILGISIDSWFPYVTFILGLTVLAFLEQWRFAVVTRFKTHLKDPKKSYIDLCKTINCDPNTNWCTRKLALFKATDGLAGAIFKVLPILVVSQARQLQYSFPMFAVEIIGGTIATLQQVEQKTGYPRKNA